MAISTSFLKLLPLNRAVANTVTNVGIGKARHFYSGCPCRNMLRFEGVYIGTLHNSKCNILVRSDAERAEESW